MENSQVAQADHWRLLYIESAKRNIQLEAEAEAQAAQMARACRELADLERAAKDQSEIAYESGYESGYEDALRKMWADS